MPYGHTEYALIGWNRTQPMEPGRRYSVTSISSEVGCLGLVKKEFGATAKVIIYLRLCREIQYAVWQDCNYGHTAGTSVTTEGAPTLMLR